MYQNLIVDRGNLMNRTTALVETLKHYLKAKGMTYRQLAGEMGLSEASIKRMFSKQAFSLARLEEVCRILDIDFYELALMDRKRNREPGDRLTTEQEQILIHDEKLRATVSISDCSCVSYFTW